MAIARTKNGSPKNIVEQLPSFKVTFALPGINQFAMEEF
jgi:hypothetical protein